MTSSVQHEMASMCWEKAIGAPSLSHPFKEDQALPLSTPLLQVNTGVVSSALCQQVLSQAPQQGRSSEMQAACDGCFARQSVCSVISLHSSMSWAVHPQQFWGSIQHEWLLPPPLSSWRLRQHRVHCLHRWWLYLAWQWSPTMTVFLLMTEPSACTMSSCGYAIFSAEKLDLWLFCLLFPGFLAGVSHRDARISLDTFPTPWFAWAQSAGILAVLSPLLDPSKTCLFQSASLCVFHGFMEWVVGIFYNTEVCFDLLHFQSGLHWWEV